jgi:predicted RNase H-like nuclease (RuvC/YqgF family)
MTNDILNEFKALESRNAKLILENRKLKGEVDRLREEKQLMYKHLLRMKNEMNEHFDKIGKVYFADDFYEE